MAIACVVPGISVWLYRTRFRQVFTHLVGGRDPSAEAPLLLANGDDSEAGLHPQSSGPAKQSLGARVTTWVLGDDAKEWVARDRSRTGTLMRHFGMFFDVYEDKAAWFFIVELAFSVFVSAIAGAHESLGCSPLAWLMAAAYLLLTLLMVALRPHIAPLDRLLYAALAMVQAAAATFAAASIELGAAHGYDSEQATSARDAAGFFISAVSMSAGAAGLYELAKVVYQQVLTVRRDRARRAAEAADANNPALLLASPQHADSDAMEALELMDMAAPPVAMDDATVPPAPPPRTVQDAQPPRRMALPAAPASPRPVVVAAAEYLNGPAYSPKGEDDDDDDGGDGGLDDLLGEVDHAALARLQKAFGAAAPPPGRGSPAPGEARPPPTPRQQQQQEEEKLGGGGGLCGSGSATDSNNEPPSAVAEEDDLDVLLNGL
jgi:hypothetical protein